METLLDDSVCCKLCAEVFNSPVLLSCGHSICLKCAETNFSFHRLKKSNVTNDIICPTCNKPTEIPTDSDLKTYLKPNLELKESIEKLKKKNAAPECDNECGANASLYCDNCASKFCQNCFQECHSKAVFRSHQKVPIEEAKRKSPSCSKHTDELIKLFCKKCNEPVCLMCQFGDHRGHDCILLVDYSNRVKEEIVREAKELEARAKTLQDSSLVIQREMENIKSTHSKFNTELKSLCKELIEMVKVREQELLKASEQIEVNKSNYVLFIAHLQAQKLQQQFEQVKVSSEKLFQLSKDYQTAAYASKNPHIMVKLSQATKVALKQFELKDFSLTPFVVAKANLTLNSSNAKKNIPLLGYVSDIGPPDPPKKATLVAATNSSLNIRWDPPNENGEKITRYEVEVGKNKFREMIGSFSTSKTDLTIGNLTRGTNYDVRVVAVNAIGRSAFGEFTQFQTKQYKFFFVEEHRLGNPRKHRIENGGLTVVNIDEGDEVAIASVEFNTGVHYWEIQVNKYTNDSYVEIGVVDIEKISTKYTYLASSKYGWSFETFNTTSGKRHNGDIDHYGEPFTTNSVVGVVLDCDTSMLTFFHNGKHLGKAFDLPKGTTFSPAVCLPKKGDKITLNPNVEVPEVYDLFRTLHSLKLNIS